MTVFTAEVAARRTSGFTIDSLIGKDKDSHSSDKPSRPKHGVDGNRPSGSPGPRVHRPTPLVSATVVRPKADCSPCSALNLSVSGGPSGQPDRTLLLSNKTNCDTSPTDNGGPIFGLNYLDAVNHPLLVRRGLSLNAQPNPQLWAHYSPELHRNLSINGPLFGRGAHLRPPLPFAPGAGVMPFHPALVNPHRDFFHPYHWNVRHQDSLQLPHLAGPGAGLFFHAFRKPKRHRTAFSPAQLLKLEHAFDRNQYVVGQERKALAEDLNLSETQVKVWFQNRRTKFKRVKTEGDMDEMDESPTHETECPLDGKVSHHVTRWKRETHQVEVVDSDVDDDSDCPEPIDDKDV